MYKYIYKLRNFIINYWWATCHKLLTWIIICLFITKKIAWKRLRKNENIYAKNEVEKKRKIAALIIKKKKKSKTIVCEKLLFWKKVKK